MARKARKTKKAKKAKVDKINIDTSIIEEEMERAEESLAAPTQNNDIIEEQTT